MKLLRYLILFAFFVFMIQPADAVDGILFTLSPTGARWAGQLTTISPLTGELLSHKRIDMPGVTVDGGNALARDPTTGKLYAALNVAGQLQLATIDPATGVATHIGGLNRHFSGFAFDPAGTLYGVTDEQSSTPESLFIIDKTNASSTFVVALGNGNDGDALAFNPNDGLLYHASGNDTLGAPPLAEVFESVNPGNLAVTNIPLSGDYTPFTSNYLQVASLSHSHGNVFFLADGDQFQSAPGPRLYTITTGGVVKLLGPMDHTATGMALAPRPTSDFERDLKSDIAIYRDGSWNILQSSDGTNNVVNWGGDSWQPVRGDFDGDGKADVAVYNSAGVWSILRSWFQDNEVIQWSGAAGDIPVPADYDGDGTTDFAVYNPTSAIWSIIRSSDGGLTTKAWGGPSWRPVVADYDGDGKADIAVYDASGLWSIVRSSDGGNSLFGWSGAANDIPVPTDYDGDGRADFALYNPDTAWWSIIRSSDQGLTARTWGGAAWQPVAADYDGDGKTDIAVYNPSTGMWSIVRSSDGQNSVVTFGGAPQDVPLTKNN